MSDSVSISGPVHVIENSTARVALELMHWIEIREREQNLSRHSDRNYWLDLYAECHKAAAGRRGQD